jgi:hypothetical protein
MRFLPLLALACLLAAPARAGLYLPLTVEERLALPGGGQVVIHSATPRSHSVKLRVSLVAGREDVVLALSGALLEDDRGNRYAFLPPPENAQLWLPQGLALEGYLLFAGSADPAATRFTLRFNPNFGAAPRVPQLAMPFTLPGRIAAPAPMPPPGTASLLANRAIGEAPPLANRTAEATPPRPPAPARPASPAR